MRIKDRIASNILPFRCVFFLLVIMLWPVFSFASTTQEYVKEAQGYIESGKLSAAVIQLKNALLLTPDDPEVRLRLGVVYADLGDGASAEKEITIARAKGAKKTEWLVPLGRVYLLLGRADDVLEEIVAEEFFSAPLRADILHLRGKAYLLRRQFDKADEAFVAVLELQAGRADALLGRAYVAIYRNDAERASQYVEEALSVEPDNVGALMIKAELFRSAGKFDAALSAYQSTLDLAPSNVAARLGKASTLIASGKNDKAIQELDGIRAIYPDLYLGHYLKALALFQNQDLEPAKQSVQLALKQMPDYLPSHLLAGTIAYQQGQMAEAEFHLRNSWTAAQNNVMVAKLLAATLLKLNDPDAAIKVLGAGLQAGESDAQLLALLGSAYLRNGETGKGLEHLEKAVSIAPDVATLRTRLAIGQLLQGKTTQTADELAYAIEFDQGLVQAEALQVLMHIKQNDFRAALQAARDFVGRSPESALAENLVATAYLGLRDYAAARSAFEKSIKLDPGFLPGLLNLAALDHLEGHVDTAESRYREVLAQDENNFKALLALSQLSARTGNTDAAVKWLKQARSSQPGDTRPGLLLLHYQQLAGDRDKAQDVANELLAAFPEKPEVLRAVAIYQMKVGQEVEALATLRRLVDIESESPQAHLLLSKVQMKLRDYAAARKGVLRSLELSMDNPDAHLILGRLEVLEKHFDVARSIAEKLQAHYPEATYGYELEGEVASAQADYKASFEAYALAYEKAPSARLAKSLFRAQRQAGEDAGAYAVLQHWLDANPSDIEIRMILTTAQHTAGLHEDAKVGYQTVLEYDPGNLLALNNLAWLYHKEGYGDGLQYALKAYELAPDNPKVIDTYGWMLLNDGQIQRGLVMIQEAVAKAPHMAEIRYHLAVALERAGRQAESRKELDQLLRLEQDFPSIDEARKLLFDLSTGTWLFKQGIHCGSLCLEGKVAAFAVFGDNSCQPLSF